MGRWLSYSFEYQCLEQYEDTLNNLELPRAAEWQKILKLFSDEYLLRYMLEFETQGSPLLLNLDRLKDPFIHKLKVQEGDGPSTGSGPERPVDLVDIFNYLLGIQVKRVRAFKVHSERSESNNGRLYRLLVNGACFAKDAEAIEPEFKRLMFATVGA